MINFQKPSENLVSFFIVGLTEQYSYSCSLLGLPDLPSWLRYTYSKQQHAGFLYGTPPVVQQNLQVNDNNNIILVLMICL